MSEFCNICGSGEDTTIEFGAMKSSLSSGSIGMDICETCRRAAEWHDEKGGSQCVSCGDATPERTILLDQPGPKHTDRWGVEIEMCKDCYNDGGLMHMYESESKLRARANIETEWEQQRRTVLSRDGYRCRSCGVGDCRLHVHHKIPQSEGGTDHPENLISLCPECHASEHGKQACLLCGGLTDQFGTWFDSSGGVGVHICGSCQEYLKRGSGSSRCTICARFDDGDGRSEGILFKKENREDLEARACDECRKVLAFKPWPARQQYVDEYLPDSHVDVKHWEAER